VPLHDSSTKAFTAERMLRDKQINAQKRLWDLAIWSFNFENNSARLNRALIKQQICSTTRKLRVQRMLVVFFFFFFFFFFGAQQKPTAWFTEQIHQNIYQGHRTIWICEAAAKKHLKCRNLISGYSRTRAIRCDSNDAVVSRALRETI